MRRVDLTGKVFGRLTVIGPGRKRGGRLTWECRCTCGSLKSIQGYYLRSGITRSCGCLAKEQPRGDKSPNWKGGWINPKGYHSQAHIDSEGRRRHTLAHRTEMEKHLGRPLLPGETVHHINGDRLDNRIENLELWASAHRSGQRVSDLVSDAVRVLHLYAPGLLKETNDT